MLTADASGRLRHAGDAGETISPRELAGHAAPQPAHADETGTLVAAAERSVSLRKAGRSVAPTGSNQLYFLQALRAIAAWLVVVDHALLALSGNSAGSALTLAAWHIGNAGVSIFFVISGFIMVHVSWKDFGQAGATAAFLRRRFIRIAPFYWLATLAALAVHRFSYTHGAADGWPQLAQSVFFIPYQNETGAWYPILPQGWTLSYEVVFYLVFAASLALRRWTGLAGSIACLAALSVAGQIAPSGRLGHVASLIVLWFVLGIAAGVYWRSHGLREPHWLQARLRFLAPFGNASYSTYLVHGIVLTTLFRLYEKAFTRPSLWFIPLGLLAATAVGLVVYRVIEKPLVRRLSFIIPELPGRKVLATA